MPLQQEEETGQSVPINTKNAYEYKHKMNTGKNRQREKKTGE
jgi:hypothetical protein